MCLSLSAVHTNLQVKKQWPVGSITTTGLRQQLNRLFTEIGIPTDEEFPFTNDYAISVIQRGKVEQYAREQEGCPEGLVVNRDGKSETDPYKILDDLIGGRCAFTPIGGLTEETGGHKGYGFATVVEILSSALQQGAFLRQLCGVDAQGKPAPYALGHFFLAIDIACFADVDAFKKTTSDILRTLRNSKKIPGRDRIYTCGEKEYLASLERIKKGVPVNPVVQQQLCTMRDELGLPNRFPFETSNHHSQSKEQESALP